MVTGRIKGSSERGGVLSMTALMLPALLGLTALVVDLGALQSTKSSLQNISMSAAEGAYRRVDTPADAIETAERLARTQLSSVPRLADVEIIASVTGAEISVVISGKAGATFGRLVGFDGFVVRSSWTAGPS